MWSCWHELLNTDLPVPHHPDSGGNFVLDDWERQMKIETSTVTKLTITGAPALDPITVILEDIEPRKGKIIIECYGKSWSAYWGGMGDRTIAQFFCSMDEHYIAKNLDQGIDSSIVDSDSIKDGALRQVIAMRRGRMIKSFLMPGKLFRYGRDDITLDDARELWGEIEDADFGDDGWRQPDLMQRIFGDEWWCLTPTKPNPDYQYLCRIICAVQQALASAIPDRVVTA